MGVQQIDYWAKMQAFMCKYCGESVNIEYTQLDFFKLGKRLRALMNKTKSASYDNLFFVDIEELFIEKNALCNKQNEDKRAAYLTRLSATKSKWPDHEFPVFLSLDADAESDLYKYHIKLFRSMKHKYDQHCANEMQ